MVEFIGSLIIRIINALGYPGVFILMTLESAGIPFPSFITMPFAGSLISHGKFNFFLLILIGTLGNLTGSLLAFWFGWWGQEAFVRKIIKKWGKYILITESKFNQSEEWFRKYGEPVVFFARLIPVVRAFISLPAGIAKMNLKRFIVYTTTGSFLWSLFLTYIGMILGNNWRKIEDYFHKLDLVIIIALLLLFFSFLYYQFRKIKTEYRRRKIRS